VLVLRSDMTIPIARVVATRYATADPPLRFCYFAHAYRAVRPQRGQPREFLQAGVELVGAPAPHGTAEVLTVLGHALDAAGLEGYKIGLGDASLYPSLLRALDVPEEVRGRMLRELVDRDFVGLEREARELGVADEVLRVAQLRGGPEVLEAPPGPVADAIAGLRAVYELLEPAVAERIIFDLGLLRDLDYYTGAVFEAYASGLGFTVANGGRYDNLLARFGHHDLPATGFAIYLERLLSVLPEGEPVPLLVLVGGGLEGTRTSAALRAAGVPTLHLADDVEPEGAARYARSVDAAWICYPAPGGVKLAPAKGSASSFEPTRVQDVAERVLRRGGDRA
jgi:ATP phosphoribosyltransferase regulatory subunit